MKQLTEYLISFAKLIVEFDKEAPQIPSSVQKIFSILKTLLIMSYLETYSKRDYKFMISVVVRPQRFLYIAVPSLVWILFSLFYFAGIFIKYKGRAYIALFGQFLRTGILNFLLETTGTSLCYMSQCFIIIISLIQEFILLGSLDVEMRNFQKLKINFFDHLIWITNILQSLLWYYNAPYQQYFALAQSIITFKGSIHYLNSTISIFTTFLIISQILGDQNYFNSELLMFPCILRICHFLESYKQSSFKKASPEEDLIEISQLLTNKQYNKAFYKIYEIVPNKGFFYEIHRGQLKQKCLHQIQMHAIGNSNPSIPLVNAANSIVSEDKQYINHTRYLLSLLKQKLDLLMSVKVNTFSQYYEYLQDLVKYSNQLKQLYQEKSSRKYKGLLLFLLLEIENNFEEARTISKQNIDLKDEEYEIGKLGYVICQYDTRITIKHIQKVDLLPKDAQDHIQSFIPPGIRESHDKLIENFLITGKSTLLSRVNTIFLVKDDPKIMFPIEFFFNITLKSDLEFILFFQPTIEKPMAILLNQQQEIKCLSEQLLDQLGLTSQTFGHYGNNIKRVIPFFNSKESYQENVEIYFYEFEYDVPFVSNIQVYVTKVDSKPIYYKVIFEYLKKYSSKTKSFNKLPSIAVDEKYNSRNQLSTNHNPELEISERESIVLPYIDEYEQREPSVEAVVVLTPPVNENQHSRLMEKKKTVSTKFRRPTSDDLKVEIRNKENTPSTEDSDEGKKKQYIINYYLQEYQSPKVFTITLFISFLIPFAFNLLILFSINTQLNKQVNDLNILKFAQFCLQPIETQQLSLFTMNRYFILYSLKLFNSTKYQTLMQFPVSNFESGYYNVEENLNIVFSERQFTTILDENSIEVFQYESTNEDEGYLVSLRCSLSLLLNFQYSVLLQYKTTGTVNIDSPDIYFTYKNYSPLQEQVSQLSFDLMDQIIYVSEQASLQQIMLFAIGALTFSISLFFSYWLSQLVLTQINRYYNLTSYMNDEELEKEIFRIKNVILNFEENVNYFDKYNYVSKHLKKTNKFVQQKQKSNKKSIQSVGFVGSFMIFFIVIMVKFSVQFFITQIYIKGYGDVAKFYDSLSELGLDLVTIYCCKEAIYYQNSFPYLSQSDLTNLLSRVDSGLNRTKYFIDNSALTNMPIVTDTYKQYYNEIMSGDLCSYLSEDLKAKSANICNLVLNGNMQNGLLPALNLMYNNLITEKKINNFTKRSSLPIFELEGPSLLADIVSNLSIDLKIDLEQETSSLLHTILIITIVILVLLGLLMFLTKSLVHDYLQKKIQVSKRFLTFIPIQSQLFNAIIERQIKKIIYKRGLL